jgi:PLP dependent protein
MTHDCIAANLQQVRERIGAAAKRAGRAPQEIELIAVSKNQPAEAIRAAFEAGQRTFGENYLQEALAKMDRLADLDIEWHFIGRIQANKTRQIAARFDWVHGLADAVHALRLSEQRSPAALPLNVCLQVNVSGETTKGGLAPTEVDGLLDLCEGLPGIRVRGFMTMPPPAQDEQTQRQPFHSLHELRDRLITPNRSLDCLSMGMSDDLEAAILEGATHVRIGTAVFGTRPYN